MNVNLTPTKCQLRFRDRPRSCLPSLQGDQQGYVHNIIPVPIRHVDSFAEVAKDSNASVSTRVSAAGDAIGDKVDQHGHEVSTSLSSSLSVLLLLPLPLLLLRLLPSPIHQDEDILTARQGKADLHKELAKH